MDEKPYKIINGDSLKVLDAFEENSVDSIVTDPPYGLTSITKRFGKENSAPAQYGKDGSFARLSKGFMGKEWDGSGIEYNVELWSKALRVLKPGGYLLAFGGTRTFHRIACAIEDAGFEIRDTIMYLYGSGFPKSLNIGLAVDKLNGVESKVVGEQVTHDFSKNRGSMMSFTTSITGKQESMTINIKQAQNEWQGWGTALKPAYEPIIVARKPIKTSVAENVIKNGVGGINIDECRVGTEVIGGGTMPDLRDVGKKSKEAIGIDKLSFGQVVNAERKDYESHTGRFPANIIHDGSDEVVSGFPESSSNGGNASRFFYSAKASKKDRDGGLDAFDKIKVNDGRKTEIDNAFQRGETPRKNIHPTVKPIELMQYLVRLVTPKNGTVLDIFNGSGSTGKACMFENRERNANYKYIGIELDPEYCKISEARIDYALNKFKYDVLEEIKENEEKGQLSLFSNNDEKIQL